MVVRESAPITTPPSNSTAIIDVCTARGGTEAREARCAAGSRAGRPRGKGKRGRQCGVAACVHAPGRNASVAQRPRPPAQQALFLLYPPILCAESYKIQHGGPWPGQRHVQPAHAHTDAACLRRGGSNRCAAAPPRPVRRKPLPPLASSIQRTPVRCSVLVQSGAPRDPDKSFIAMVGCVVFLPPADT